MAKKKVGVDAGDSIVVHKIFPEPPVLLEQLSSPVGDMNLLLDRVPFTTPVGSKLLKGVAEKLIKETKGILPQIFGVFDFVVGQLTKPRLVVKWSISRSPRLTDIHGVHQIVKRYCGEEVRGLKPNGHGWETVIKYRDSRDKVSPKRCGVYFGPSSLYHSGSYGVTVTRIFKRDSEFRFLKEEHPNDWLSRSAQGGDVGEFEVELREGDVWKGDDDRRHDLAQANLLSLIVQLSYFLEYGGFIDFRTLAIAVFRALNLVGAEKASRARLFGLGEVLDTIERVLLLPLQQPHLAKFYGFPAESILMVGAPGVGKTTVAKFLMGQKYNAIFAAVNTDKLLLDLSAPEGSGILLEIDKIGAATKLPVVLLIDDIDSLLGSGDKSATLVSKVLNLLQGIREKGFYVIASTNHPEKIDARLLEPGRLSKIVYVSLPSYEDRLGILRLITEGKPFVDEDDRNRIIAAMAKETEGWTGRYLEELVFEAGRISSQLLVSDSAAGAEPLAEGCPLTSDHFQQAKELVLASIDLGSIKKWDESVRKFARRGHREIGFIGSQNGRKK